MKAAVCSREELIAILLAKQMRNGEVGFTGLATGSMAARYITGIPLAAMSFARHTHAPDLTILLAGWCINPYLSQLRVLPSAEFDNHLQQLPCEAQMQAYPGHYAVRRGEVDFGFGSGVQVDRQGNINSTCIGAFQQPEVRLVGSILLPEHLTCFGREYLMMPRHDRRTLVEKVDYISGVGWPGGQAGRYALGLERGGPQWIVTPLAIFSFDRQQGNAQLHSIHPGVTLQQVRDHTGFAITNEEVAVTPWPDAEELSLLRRVVNPHGALIPHTEEV
ncbi:hypothetical protein BL250_10685 [Erwinia sp. OLTSP20]|uniref:CoA-transferase n=1 Tax=unclassified Erwinia TaxID=2622719 RepID=UPI000C19068B|nr:MULTISPECIES: CoA-transferase [unclassified Erwinia]PIJ50146.1 hypothetical protein BV501_09915 [Erwinia sp. OAMSP11]PIJ71912.1 hypothetical protein BK416_10995 [Erwinia sp. OLSSP12]PIJ81114.1 hypothetical protein BLD47_09855 [Erwinia sp. OLCASP19]PIJ83544.1 hypothetical protein BLD46_09645 [Erwinia sp. OLMTSP26]PIJ86159.1 hypothetical protein BLD49_08970 [Erwinia sp. OLMDSP33]